MKKVSAPLTYKPSGNRPKEHLAYLNKSEMKELRRLNGNNIERGPSGLPSFPPADAQGSSSKASSSKTSSKSSGSSSVSRISGGSSGSNAARSASNAASSSRSPSGGGRDSGQVSSSRGNVSSSRNGISSIPTSKTVNVGPMGTPVKVGVSRGAYPITRMPNIEAPSEKMPESIRNFVSRNALMLDPMSKYTDPSWPQNVANSMDPGFSGGQIFSGLGNFFSPSNITKSIYDAGTGLIKSGVDVASDPYGSLKKGIGSIGDYFKGSYDLMGDAAMGDETSVGPAFMRSLDLPISSGIMSQFAPRPANSVGMFVGPNASSLLRDTYKKGRELKLKGASNEDMFNETAKLTGPGVSGLQNIPNSPYWGYEVSAPMNLREGLFKPSSPIKSAENYVFGTRVEGMPTLGKISDTGSLTYMYGGDIPRTPVTQSYSPYQRGFYPSGGRRTSGGYDPNTDVIEINDAASRGMLSGFAKNYIPDEFRKTLIHEGQHKIAKLDPVFVPQGTNNEALLRFYQKYGVTPPPIEDIRRPSRDVYLGNKGEILARLSEQRADIPASQMKDYGTRITAQNKEWDRVNAAQKAYQDALDYIRSMRNPNMPESTTGFGAIRYP